MQATADAHLHEDRGRPKGIPLRIPKNKTDPSYENDVFYRHTYTAHE
jgi:hypothetical protein